MPTTLPTETRWGEAELARLRDETPGTRERIHLNNAGSSLPPRSVLEASLEHLELEARIGGYEAENARREEIRATYEAVGRLLGAPADHVAFVENATVAFAQALSSVPFERGDVILTSREDYVSNQLMLLSLAKRFGIVIERTATAPEGGLDLDDLRRRLESRPRLLALTHAPTNSGLVQPVREAGELAREKGVLYLVDVCQTVGQRPVDMGELNADFLTSTSRKFLRGPRGFGFMAVSRRRAGGGPRAAVPRPAGATWTEADRYETKPTAARFENWEFAYALLLATGVAARYAMDVGIERIAARTTELANRLRAGLEASGFRVLDRGTDRCAIVTAEVPGQDPVEFMARLEARRLNGTASLREYGRIDFEDKDVEWALRLSPALLQHRGGGRRGRRDRPHRRLTLTLPGGTSS